MYILMPLCLIVAGVFLYVEKKENYNTAVVLKGVASLLFVLFGFSNYMGVARDRYIIAGLIIGMVADILLNLRFCVPKEFSQKVFLVGILTFLAGHIVYLIGVFPFNGHPVLSILLAAIMTFLILKWIFSKITAEKAFKIFGIVYIGAIVLLNCVALFNVVGNSGTFFMVFFVGCVLFLASDIILILNTFGSETRFELRIANIMLYYLGQLMIALSLLYF